MFASIIDIVLVEDNPADVGLFLDALQENKLANRVKVLRDGAKKPSTIYSEWDHMRASV